MPGTSASWGAVEILRAEGHGDETVCLEGNGCDREALHAEIARLIDQFLRGAGFAPLPR
jgi:hypothetical protein